MSATAATPCPHIELSLQHRLVAVPGDASPLYEGLYGTRVVTRHSRVPAIGECNVGFDLTIGWSRGDQRVGSSPALRHSFRYKFSKSDPRADYPRHDGTLRPRRRVRNREITEHQMSPGSLVSGIECHCLLGQRHGFRVLALAAPANVGEPHKAGTYSGSRSSTASATWAACFMSPAPKSR